MLAKLAKFANTGHVGEHERGGASSAELPTGNVPARYGQNVTSRNSLDLSNATAPILPLAGLPHSVPAAARGRKS
jgi:hypothetical protein